MKEEYLHHVFKKKMLGNSFKTVNNQSLNVIDFGEHNSNAGPDFLDAKILHDGHIWAGPIEFHVNASDWYKHKHQTDAAYNNVIAHFVYNYDTDVLVNEFQIPTVELQDKINLNHFDKYKGLVQADKSILCQDGIPEIDSAIIEEQLKESLGERLWKKALVIIQDVESNIGDRDKAFISAISRVFGGQVNYLPFQMLADKLDPKWFAKLNYESIRIEALVLGLSGLLNFHSDSVHIKKLQTEFVYQKKLFGINEMPKQNWKYSRMRPHNFPDLRLAQFAAWLNSRPATNDFLTTNWDLKKWRAAFYITLDPFWKHHFRLKTRTENRVTTHLSKSFVDLVFINAVVPFIYAIGLWEGNDAYTKQAMEVLKKIKPEKNSVIKEWKKAGVKVNSAFETQSLLELKKQGCNRKKCLFCALGKSILNR